MTGYHNVFIIRKERGDIREKSRYADSITMGKYGFWGNETRSFYVGMVTTHWQDRENGR